MSDKAMTNESKPTDAVERAKAIEAAENFDVPHDDEKYYQAWDCFHYTDDAVHALMADHAAAELAAYRERLRAKVEAMSYRIGYNKSVGAIALVNKADVLELIGADAPVLLTEGQKG